MSRRHQWHTFHNNKTQAKSHTYFAGHFSCIVIERSHARMREIVIKYKNAEFARSPLHKGDLLDARDMAMKIMFMATFLWLANTYNDSVERLYGEKLDNER